MKVFWRPSIPGYLFSSSSGASVASSGFIFAKCIETTCGMLQWWTSGGRASKFYSVVRRSGRETTILLHALYLRIYINLDR